MNVDDDTVFKVADSGRQGRISWEDFKVFETRESMPFLARITSLEC